MLGQSWAFGLKRLTFLKRAFCGSPDFFVFEVPFSLVFLFDLTRLRARPDLHRKVITGRASLLYDVWRITSGVG